MLDADIAKFFPMTCRIPVRPFVDILETANQRLSRAD
jgi:hypothetical protein